MVKCTFFEPELRFVNNASQIVKYSIRTDLPAGTHVLLSCWRTYAAASGKEALWIGHSERLVLQQNPASDQRECHGEIDIESSDKQGLAQFRQLNNSPNPLGISGPVSDLLEITFTVGARQRLKEFGHHNAELCGPVVSRSGDLDIVRCERRIMIPIDPAVQPFPILGEKKWEEEQD